MEEEAAHGAEQGLTFEPLEVFNVRPLFGHGEVHWYTITNATLWMAIAVLAIFALFVLGTARRSVVPTRSQSVAELVYNFVYKMVEDVAGHDGVRYFPYILTLFLFILFVNYLGLIPLSFSPTSHIAVTAIMGFGVFVAVTVLVAQVWVFRWVITRMPVLGFEPVWAAEHEDHEAAQQYV